MLASFWKSFLFCRAFIGPSDETSLVEQAVLFGELIQSNKETGVDFDTYYSMEYYSGEEPVSKTSIQEIWFQLQ